MIQRIQTRWYVQLVHRGLGYGVGDRKDEKLELLHEALQMYRLVTYIHTYNVVNHSYILLI